MATVQPQQADDAAIMKTAAAATESAAGGASSVSGLRVQVAENSQYIQDLVDMVVDLRAEVDRLKGMG